ncbi:MAG TPA: Gfo/Idh/MocA family oxidoreductase [Flavobacterium sp.]|uniref:Gfo/Idh/MocA family protein n=1 Tax=Flavobacterium sp. TaxID=239 RepID=UPI002DBC1F6F|nr:Gfo/Idh/MocA family oxidoreductase [Flavobacterium sp.]HEU4788699.1 Gfo/Idh/MocA family oxidoreductase [Flavobacterium sp.]
MSRPINIAVVGVGSFAHFAVAEFVKIPGVKLVGGYDENEKNILRLKEIDESAIIFPSLDAVCSEPTIDLVYIATPPYLHYQQSKAALLAGKHVICEKPAATKLQEAIELRALAEERNLLYVVNLMQRYNPLFEKVQQLIQNQVLGDFLHGFFENYASDEFLSKEHWFWDEEKSGGIFIEHGVHFFDMFSGWLGDGKVKSSKKVERFGHKGIWDKVQSVVQYGNGLVNFYHGFDQPKIMDRQEMRLLFEKGEITLFEWVPTRLKMTALCTEEELQTLKQIFPNAAIEIIEYFEQSKVSKGRFKNIHYQYKLGLDTGDDVQKQTLYQELVSAMFMDQKAWIDNNTHVRKINQDNAVHSLEIAEISENLAIKIHE